ncbi:diphosphoinositol polyphosphate phosphohydrolase 1-like [Liolophura sinensis]|uniref:diphosphoinositol polyphosphate phosphohydrolase 1-like n=1 Tax=Liolophura sinensis TaxID=3198878 RepID=UPI0031599311
MVKEKPNSVRTYDEDGFRRRAACLCFKDASEQEVLLVSSSRMPDRWVVPGGGVEPLEDPENAAKREILEEAGVRGELGRHLGVFENVDRKHRTLVYVFIATELLEEWEDLRSMGRKRKWFSLAEAREHLSSFKAIQVNYLDLLEHEKVT